MRKCIIVGNPGELGDEHYCKGVNKDLENYKRFLREPLGGFWRESEINVLVRPTVSALNGALGYVGRYDHLLFIYAGHGWYSSSRSSTMLELQKGVSFDSDELRGVGYSKLIILDCCREVYPELHEDRFFAKALDEAAPPILHPDECRKRYDESIDQCGQCLIVLNSCSIGQTSGDSAQRGDISPSAFWNLSTSFGDAAALPPLTPSCRYLRPRRSTWPYRGLNN